MGLADPVARFYDLSSSRTLELRRGEDHLAGALEPVTRQDQLTGFILRLDDPRSGKSRARERTQQWSSVYRFTDVIGASPALCEAVRAAKMAAASHRPVLVSGESGTGKELFAHAIHAASSRASNPFVALKCGGVNEELLASELFGYDEGAFTGAARGGRPGKLEIADGGTLLLDEVEEISPRMQVHLLRFLEDGEVIRVGGRRPRRVDVRVIAATNVDLRRSVVKRRFRQDLFYRPNVLPIVLPPLRDRKGDIPLLAEHILATENLGKRLSRSAIERICAHDWPGNVCELRNVLVQSSLRTAGEWISVEDLALPEAGPLPSREENGAPTLRDVEREALLEALRRCGGNASRAAELLDVHRVTLYRKMKRHGIRVTRDVG